MWSALSTQHSALSTQHSALSTQHSARNENLYFFKALFVLILFSSVSINATAGCFKYRIHIPYYGFVSNPWTDYYDSTAEACRAAGSRLGFTYSLIGFGFDPFVADPKGDICGFSNSNPYNVSAAFGLKGGDWYKYDENCTVLPPTLIGYFNGVANTRLNAGDSLDRLRREYGAIYKSKPLTYDLFYNQTTCESGTFRVGKIPCLEDIAEVFEQRSNELNSALKNRWEHFWEMLSGRTSQDGSLTATLTSKLGKFGQAILQLLDNIYALIINQFVGSLPMLLNSLNGTPTLNNNASHLVKLKTYADKGSGMVLIAHSQGNLFVNAAYDGLKTAAPAAKVQVVHIAPASPTLRGGYALADVDYVIRTLRQLVTGLPSVNIKLPLSANDRTGHSFEGTYLDVSRKAYERVKTMINTALDGV